MSKKKQKVLEIGDRIIEHISTGRRISVSLFMYLLKTLYGSNR